RGCSAYAVAHGRRRSGAAAGTETRARATSSVTTDPSGFAYVGTTHMPLIVGSSATSAATASASGPSGVMGTVTISMPRASHTEKWRSYPGTGQIQRTVSSRPHGRSDPGTPNRVAYASGSDLSVRHSERKSI